MVEQFRDRADAVKWTYIAGKLVVVLFTYAFQMYNLALPHIDKTLSKVLRRAKVLFSVHGLNRGLQIFLRIDFARLAALDDRIKYRRRLSSAF